MRIGDQLILLRKILSFAAIAKTGNVTAAALENGMKQSNLSGYVKELEEKVGKNLYEISCSIEKSVYKINSYKQQNNNVSGAVRLWTSDGLAAAYLSSCLPGFYQLYPDVRIEILCSIEAPSVLYDADLAVVYEKPVHPDAVILFKHNLRFGLFASMDYLASFGYPKDIEDHSEKSPSLRTVQLSGSLGRVVQFCRQLQLCGRGNEFVFNADAADQGWHRHCPASVQRRSERKKSGLSGQD